LKFNCHFPDFDSHFLRFDFQILILSLSSCITAGVLFKNLEDFQNIPGILKEEIFIKGFEAAEIAYFNENHLSEYEESLKVCRDLKAVVKTAYEEGKKKAANG
jgi:hypothetical protein